VIEFKQHLLSSIDKRFSECETRPMLAKATVLDPRFKLDGFRASENARSAKELELKELREIIAEQPNSAAANLTSFLKLSGVIQETEALAASADRQKTS
jgi:hypothetical protein